VIPLLPLLLYECYFALLVFLFYHTFCIYSPGAFHLSTTVVRVRFTVCGCVSYHAPFVFRDSAHTHAHFCCYPHYGLRSVDVRSLHRRFHGSRLLRVRFGYTFSFIPPHTHSRTHAIFAFYAYGWFLPPPFCWSRLVPFPHICYIQFSCLHTRCATSRAVTTVRFSPHWLVHTPHTFWLF